MNIAPLLLMLLLVFQSACDAEKDDSIVASESPDRAYAIKLLPTNDTSERTLSITHHGRELAHYIFDNELLSVYWSPSDKYVVINNHSGHWGWWIWIISLSDGGIVTTHGPETLSWYDRYADILSIPDLWPVVARKIIRIYPGVLEDQMREGYSTVAYGWNRKGYLLLFHQFPFDRLYVNTNTEIVGYSELDLGGGQIQIRNATVKIVPYDRVKKYMPPGVAKTLHY